MECLLKLARVKHLPVAKSHVCFRWYPTEIKRYLLDTVLSLLKEKEKRDKKIEKVNEISVTNNSAVSLFLCSFNSIFNNTRKTKCLKLFALTSMAIKKSNNSWYFFLTHSLIGVSTAVASSISPSSSASVHKNLQFEKYDE